MIGICKWSHTQSKSSLLCLLDSLYQGIKLSTRDPDINLDSSLFLIDSLSLSDMSSNYILKISLFLISFCSTFCQYYYNSLLIVFPSFQFRIIYLNPNVMLLPCLKSFSGLPFQSNKILYDPFSSLTTPPPIHSWLCLH